MAGSDGKLGPQLQLVLTSTVYPPIERFGNMSASEWTLSARNVGHAPTAALCNFNSLDTVVAASSAASVLHFAGSNAAAGDFDPEIWRPTTAPSIILEPALDGRSSNGAGGGRMPMFNAYSADGAALTGAVVSIGWSGTWQANVSVAQDGLRLTARQRTFCAQLMPGEEVKAPRIMLVPWKGSEPMVGINAHRRIMLDHKIPRHPVSRLPLGWITESNGCLPSCGGSWVNWTVESQIWHAHCVQKVGMEAVWLDASWYHSCRF